MFDDDRFGRALADVTGGPVERNRAMVVVPRPGMTEDEFETLMESLADEDFAGAWTPAGWR